MNVYKSLKRNINRVIPQAFPAIRFLATLALVLFISSFPVKTFPQEEATNPRTFADLCLNKANLSLETSRTIDVLLRRANTRNCHQASRLLSTLTNISFEDLWVITDLRPLSTLTNLAELDLSGNQITDLRPLSALTQLYQLSLDFNKITNLNPLSTLTNLKYLLLNNTPITNLKSLSGLTNLIQIYLIGTQITDLRPLSSLTNLTSIFFSNSDQTLINKTCPVKPEFICVFF